MELNVTSFGTIYLHLKLLSYKKKKKRNCCHRVASYKLRKEVRT